MRGATERGHLVVGVGDFNMIPQSLAHRLITGHAPVRDVWHVLHPDSSVGNTYQAPEQARRRPTPTGEFNLVENGVTADSIFNTWRWSKADQKHAASIVIPPDSPDRRGKRIDYVFASCAGPTTEDGEGAPIEGWVVKRAKVAMTQRHPTLGCSLSDHFGVAATLAFHSRHKTRRPGGALGGALGGGGGGSGGPQEKPETRSDADATTVGDDNLALHNGAFLQSPTGSECFGPGNYDAQLAAFAPDEDRRLPDSTYDEILGIIQKYVARERGQRLWRGAHFFASVAVSIGCLIAVWFVPANFVAFILMLVSSLGLTAGTIDGLLSLLFFNWELRALKEFEWEMLNAKALLSDHSSSGYGLQEQHRSW